MNNNKPKYAICKHKRTSVYHVFPTKIVGDSKCFFSGDLAVCGDMTIHERICCIASCIDKEEVYNNLKELGDALCPNCIKLIGENERM